MIHLLGEASHMQDFFMTFSTPTYNFKTYLMILIFENSKFRTFPNLLKPCTSGSQFKLLVDSSKR